MPIKIKFVSLLEIEEKMEVDSTNVQHTTEVLPFAKHLLYTGYLLNFKLKNMSKLYYRIAHGETQQGLWYDSKGNFTGLIHNEFNFCMNTNLPMPFDPDLVGWLSATDSLEDLFNWFSKEDIERLEKYGYFITTYESEKVKQYKNHLVICQETSVIKDRVSIACL